MKKFLGLLGMLAIAVMLVGCNSCNPKEEKQDEKKEVKVLTLTPERVISTDRETMFLRTPKHAMLKWMESSATLTDFLSSENADKATFMEVTNGFQTQWGDEKSMDVKVTQITTNTMSTDSLVRSAFYLDNYPLNDKEIKVTFAEAVQKILQANCPKPQTKVLVLRSPIGPADVGDAYYIAKDMSDDDFVVFVNARTSEVTTYDPTWQRE